MTHHKVTARPPLKAYVKTILFFFGTIPLMIYAGWEDLSYWRQGRVINAELVSVPADWAFDEGVLLYYSFYDQSCGERTESDWATRIQKSNPAMLEVGKSIEVEIIPGAPGWSRLPSPIGKFFFFFSYVVGFLGIIGLLYFIDRRSRVNECASSG